MIPMQKKLPGTQASAGASTSKQWQGNLTRNPPRPNAQIWTGTHSSHIHTHAPKYGALPLSQDRKAWVGRWQKDFGTDL